MNHLFADDKTGDPAKFEKYPHRYVVIRCEACETCVYDRLAGRCLAGGPYRADLTVLRQ